MGGQTGYSSAAYTATTTNVTTLNNAITALNAQITLFNAALTTLINSSSTNQSCPDLYDMPTAISNITGTINSLTSQLGIYTGALTIPT
jgi:hypothetical protein